jgi:hypothetical protein
MSGFKVLAGLLLIAVLFVAALTYRSSSDVPNGEAFTGLFVSETTVWYPMSAEVMESDNMTLGIVAEGQLAFGRIPAGSDVKKSIMLNNDVEGPIKIRITSDGNISPYITVSNNNFVLEGNREIEVTFKPAVEGSFSGMLKVTAIKPKWIAGWLLQWM